VTEEFSASGFVFYIIFTIFIPHYAVTKPPNPLTLLTHIYNQMHLDTPPNPQISKDPSRLVPHYYDKRNYTRKAVSTMLELLMR